jgi:hypothetical protein
MPLDDPAVEADEAYQNAGEKRRAPHRPGGPAAAAGQQGAPARHLGERQPAGLRGRRSRGGPGPADGGRACRRRDAWAW